MLEKSIKRKWLAVGISTVSVILLILTSLTDVVGYQSVQSSDVNFSPLFSVRTQRATNQRQNILTSHYLGKGRYNMPFPLRDSRTAMIQRFIEQIRSMDNDTFNRFIDNAVNRINHKDNLKGIGATELINGLRQLKESSHNIIVYKDKKEGRRAVTYSEFAPTICWFPGCLLMFVGGYILMLIVLIAFLFLVPPPTPSSWGPWCQS
jgi:hypothetical protein